MDPEEMLAALWAETMAPCWVIIPKQQPWESRQDLCHGLTEDPFVAQHRQKKLTTRIWNLIRHRPLPLCMLWSSKEDATTVWQALSPEMKDRFEVKELTTKFSKGPSTDPKVLEVARGPDVR